MPPLYVTYMNRFDVEALDITDDEVLAAIEDQLKTQGRGEAVIEPRMHLEPKVARGHFNVLRGSLGGEVDSAGVKVVSDFYDNYLHKLPSELALLLLFDRHIGVPKAIIDASAITDMRTGAVTAIGAKYLAKRDAKILGHIGARGTAYWNVRLMDKMFNFEEIRVHSRRKESRDAFGERLSKDLNKKIIVTDDWESCVRGADIVVEASRLTKPEPLLKTEWIKKGALVMPYGTMSAVELSLADIADKFLMDDFGQARAGQFGALKPLFDAGKLHEGRYHAEIGQVAAGLKPGRERDDETILFWHRGLSLSDIALGHAMLTKGAKMGVGQRLRFA
ncbi:ornithine cyclodeaminase family protein [Terrarubrum flagellatum]|uniref:ornithine cyclodeaminase family protein n=1 Tax=Terrirubrum flagellatum TaxID=2895980 RepID=UPI003145144C